MGSGLPLTEWMAAESAGRTFTVAGGWGAATGVVASPPERAGWFARGRGDSARAPVVLLAPQWPGLEDALELALADDALAVGLLRGGARVARLRSVEFAGAPDPGMWIDAILDALQSAAGGEGAAGLAGTGLAGTACALASSRREDLAMLVCAAAPSAEVMSRRTPENEDDPMWETSATLRLADRLAELAPLEAVTVFPRPTLFVQGAVDALLPAAHMEAWRAALAATGRTADGIEVALADGYFRMVSAEGDTAPEDDSGLALLTHAVAAWTARTISRAGVAARRGP
jgi:fermentation-respiration switch protein FrsA (DUF1100 family)